MNTVGLPQRSSGIAFASFCIWTFILLSRPQDLFPLLKPIRPALMTGGLTLGIVFMYSKQLQGPPFFQERQIKYYTVLFLIMILGIPFSQYPRMSFMNIFTGYINVILFFFIFYKVVDSVKKLSTVLLIGCLGNGLYSAFSVIKGSLGAERLFFGGMFDPNDLAFFALGFLPLNLIFVSRENPFWIRLACLGSFGVGILLIFKTGSRGGLLGFVAAAVMLLLFKTRTVGYGLKAIFIVFGLIIFNFVPINTERFKTILSVQDDYNVTSETGRIQIWKTGLGFMISNPLTGVGVLCFNRAIGLDREERGAERRKWQTAHNSLVQIGAETGVIGFVLFVLLSWNVVVIFRKVNKYAVSVGLVKIGEMGFVGFAGMFISAMFLSQAYSLYWAFYIVISATVNQLLIKESVSTEVIGEYCNVKK